jgi:hypothetical protein
MYLSKITAYCTGTACGEIRRVILLHRQTRRDVLQDEAELKPPETFLSGKGQRAAGVAVRQRGGVVRVDAVHFR